MKQMVLRGAAVATLTVVALGPAVVAGASASAAPDPAATPQARFDLPVIGQQGTAAGSGVSAGEVAGTIRSGGFGGPTGAGTITIHQADGNVQYTVGSSHYDSRTGQLSLSVSDQADHYTGVLRSRPAAPGHDLSFTGTLTAQGSGDTITIHDMEAAYTRR